MAPESLSQAPNRPVTTMLVVISVFVTLSASQDGLATEALVMGPQAFVDEPWRIFTSIFPHGGLIHLLFNCLWTWTLGTYFEREFGAVSLMGFVVIVAAMSTCAEYAVNAGGIGLSGVVYGVMGFLWATSRFDRRYRDAMDDQTVQLFLFWGIFCIVATVADILRIANTAHAVGLIVGYAIGFARAHPGAIRAQTVAGLVLGAAAIGLGSTVARPYVAFQDRGAIGHCSVAYDKLVDNRIDDALIYLEQAILYPEVSKECVHNYEVALVRRGSNGAPPTSE